MKIIFIKDVASNKGPICLSGTKALSIGLVGLIALPIALGFLSFWIVTNLDQSLSPVVDTEYRIAVESRVNDQKEEILKTREYVRQHLDVLGRRVGSLQAQVSRISAVEQRIAKVSGVNLEDFQFDLDPPIGGAKESEDKDLEQIDLENAIRSIEQELYARESEISAVDFLLSQRSLASQQTPAGWPVKGGWVSSSFGSRMHPMTGKKQFHKGVDIPGKLGAEIVSVADGVVVRSENSANYGWLIEIDHGDNFTTLYSHNRKNLVDVGEVIKKGQPIGEIGSSGLSTGPHVHFEVHKKGKVINPVKFLYKKV